MPRLGRRDATTDGNGTRLAVEQTPLRLLPARMGRAFLMPSLMKFWSVVLGFCARKRVREKGTEFARTLLFDPGR